MSQYRYFLEGPADQGPQFYELSEEYALQRFAEIQEALKFSPVTATLVWDHYLDHPEGVEHTSFGDDTQDLYDWALENHPDASDEFKEARTEIWRYIEENTLFRVPIGVNINGLLKTFNEGDFLEHHQWVDLNNTIHEVT